MTAFPHKIFGVGELLRSEKFCYHITPSFWRRSRIRPAGVQTLLRSYIPRSVISWCSKICCTASGFHMSDFIMSPAGIYYPLVDGGLDQNILCARRRNNSRRQLQPICLRTPYVWANVATKEQARLQLVSWMVGVAEIETIPMTFNPSSFRSDALRRPMSVAEHSLAHQRRNRPKVPFRGRPTR